MPLNISDKKSIILYRIEKSANTMTEAKDNANLRHWSLAVNRLYYSLFHMASALLLDKGIHFKSHAGAMRAIGLHFVTKGLLTTDEGKLISKLEGMRNTGDYDDLFDWEEHQIMSLFTPTEQLLSKMRSLINLV